MPPLLRRPVIHITFLGTSSAVPTLKRSLSAVTLSREGEVFLFDCGEGTQLQIKKTAVRPGRIAHIFISHLHGDHINGLIGLLQSMDLDGRTEPLRLWGPPGLEELLVQLRRLLRTNFRYPVSVETLRGDGFLFETSAYRVEAARVKHRVVTYAFSFIEYPRPGRFNVEKARELGIPEGPLFGRLQRGETVALPDGREIAAEEVVGLPRPGRKAVYAVDTRPCQAVVDLAWEADVLIHDATFDSSLRENAIESMHSTAAEAAEVAREARVRMLLLTHLSSRYLDDSPLYEEAKKIFQPVRIARDLMIYEVPYPDGIE